MGMIERTKSAAVPRRTGAAEALCDARLAVGRVTLALEDLVKDTGLSAIAAKRQLSRLRGKVVRISPRQPFYLIVSPEHRALSAPPLHWWLQDYFDWLGRPYYLALQSAASAHGSNPQALQMTQVMTDRPCRPLQVGRIQVRFFVKRGIERTPTQQPSGAVAPLRVSTPEATAYDLIRYADRIGGIERAAANKISVEGGPTEVVHDKKTGMITVTAHGPGGKRFFSVPEGKWQDQDKALVWDAAATKWGLDYAGGKPGEAKPWSVVLKRGQP